MINSIDLRINNILEYSGDYFKVKCISRNSISADRNKGLVEFKPSELNPIQLTEEILLKVGFVNDELNGSFETFENGLKFTIIDKCSAWMVYLSGPFGMIVLKHIKFVHQFQNLYFELTGQELNTAGLI